MIIDCMFMYMILKKFIYCMLKNPDQPSFQLPNKFDLILIYIHFKKFLINYMNDHKQENVLFKNNRLKIL